MWHINGAFLRGVRGHQGTNHRTVQRRSGFSHPARFERLEERLTLNAAGTVASANPTSGTGALPSGNPIQFGAPTPGGQFGGELTLVGQTLPGTGNPTSSPTPGVFGGELTSSQVPPYDSLAFNNPSWVPQDRPPFPFTSQQESGLPGNVNQVAGTPFGIRNFSIGADTSVAHGNSAQMGQYTPTVRRPTTGDTRTTEVLERPLEDALVAAELRPAAAEIAEPDGQSLGAALSVLPPGRGDAEAVALATLADQALDEAAAQDRLPDVGAESPLNGAAVDRTMAEQDQADTFGACAAMTEADEPSADPQYASTALYVLAASLALGTAAVEDPNPANDRSENGRGGKKPG